MTIGAKGIKGRDWWPLGQWQFWAIIAAWFPIAYGIGILQWFYFISFVYTPNGFIVYAAAIIHVSAFFWGIYALVMIGKEAKARRREGLPKRPPSFRILAVVVALTSVGTPIVPIAVHVSAPQVTNKIWVRVANEWRQKNLGL